MEAKLGFRFHHPRRGLELEGADAHRRDPMAQDLWDVELDLTWANDSAIQNLADSFSGRHGRVPRDPRRRNSGQRPGERGRAARLQRRRRRSRRRRLQRDPQQARRARGRVLRERSRLEREGTKRVHGDGLHVRRARRPRARRDLAHPAEKRRPPDARRRDRIQCRIHAYVRDRFEQRRHARRHPSTCRHRLRQRTARPATASAATAIPPIARTS